MEYTHLLYLALIIVTAKVLGLLMRKFGMPEVVGAILAGIILGPLVIGIVQPTNFLGMVANLGVIMIIFNAGLETSFKQIRKTGLISLYIALGGVLVPLVLGFLMSSLFHGGFSNIDKLTVLKNIFIAIILTSTSISISVETLKELGILKSKAGTIILSAAIIDDIIGIVMLSLILSFANPSISPYTAIIKTVIFFALAIGVGFFLHKLMKYIAIKHPRQRRIPIFALGVCLIYAYVAERFFGVADIIGAYIAGLIFSGISVSEYIENKIDVNAYMIFAPVFFAFIGIRSSLVGFDMNMVWFTIAFVAVGVISKIIGCYYTSRLCKLNKTDSEIIGIGMMARGEVALAVLEKGLLGMIIAPEYITSVLILVIISSLLTPILMKISFKRNGRQKYFNEMIK